MDLAEAKSSLILRLTLSQKAFHGSLLLFAQPIQNFFNWKLIFDRLCNLIFMLPGGHVFFARFSTAQFEEIAVYSKRGRIKEDFASAKSIVQQYRCHLFSYPPVMRQQIIVLLICEAGSPGFRQLRGGS